MTIFCNQYYKNIFYCKNFIINQFYTIYHKIKNKYFNENTEISNDYNLIP